MLYPCNRSLPIAQAVASALEVNRAHARRQERSQREVLQTCLPCDSASVTQQSKPVTTATFKEKIHLCVSQINTWLPLGLNRLSNDILLKQLPFYLIRSEISTRVSGAIGYTRRGYFRTSKRLSEPERHSGRKVLSRRSVEHDTIWTLKMCGDKSRVATNYAEIFLQNAFFF